MCMWLRRSWRAKSANTHLGLGRARAPIEADRACTGPLTRGPGPGPGAGLDAQAVLGVICQCSGAGAALVASS
jgi:hypothetical protein